MWINAWREYGDVVRARLGPITTHLLVRPEHMLATLAQRYQFELAAGQLVEPWSVGTLRQRETMWMVPRDRCRMG